jgi:hypothetical protein
MCGDSLLGCPAERNSAARGSQAEPLKGNLDSLFAQSVASLRALDMPSAESDLARESYFPSSVMSPTETCARSSYLPSP